MSEEQTKEQVAVEGTKEVIQEMKTEKTEAESTQQQAGVDPKKTDTEKKNYSGSRSHGGARRTGKKFGGRRGSRYGSRPKPEFDQKIINISRVTRVVKGGRRLSFRVDMIIGDKKGRVGLGSGKATDTSIAIQKALSQAKKNLLYLKLTKTHSIPHESSARITSSKVTMMPNKQRGLVAGSTMRSVLKLAGITDVTAQVNSRSKNKLNNAKAAVEALKPFQMSPEEKKVLEEKLRAKRSKEMGTGRGGYRKGGNRFNRKPRVGGYKTNK